MPSYLMSISCKPASVGAYLTVTVPSLLSVMSGLATLPDGIRTSPSVEDRNATWHICNTETIKKDWVQSICPYCSVKLCTRDLSLLDGEWDDQVKRSQPCHVQTIHSHRPVCCLGDRRQRSEVRHHVRRGCSDRCGYSNITHHRVQDRRVQASTHQETKRDETIMSEMIDNGDHGQDEDTNTNSEAEWDEDKNARTSKETQEAH